MERRQLSEEKFENQKSTYKVPENQKKKIKPTTINQIRAEKYTKQYSASPGDKKNSKLENKRPEWNDNVKAQQFFDPSIAKSVIKSERANKLNEAMSGADDKIYEPLNKEVNEKELDKDAKQQLKKKQQELLKMEKERTLVESYHTLNQLQEIIDAQNAKQNVNVLRKHERELAQLKWMINQEEVKKEDIQQVYEERYNKLKDQKQINLDMQKKLISIKQMDFNLKKQVPLDINKKVKIFEQQDFDDSDQDHPKAEYIQGMINEKDNQDVTAFQRKKQEQKNKAIPIKKEVQSQQINQVAGSKQPGQQTDMLKQLIGKEKKEGDGDGEDDDEDENEDGDQPTKERTKGSTKGMTKKQKQMIQGVQNQLQDLESQQKKQAQKVEELIQNGKIQQKKEKKQENENFTNIEKRLQKIKGIVDPLDEKLRKQEDKDVYSGSLLAKASAKMIQAYHEQITNMLIDDLIKELAHMLQQFEEKEKKQIQAERRQAVLIDYVQEFKELTIEQEEIEDRLKQIKQKTMKPLDFFDGIKPGARRYVEDSSFAKSAQVELGLGIIMNILEKRNLFSEGLNKRTHYSKKNLESFKIITDELIEDVLDEVVIELDKAGDEYTEMTFKTEFQ